LLIFNLVTERKIGMSLYNEQELVFESKSNQDSNISLSQDELSTVVGGERSVRGAAQEAAVGGAIIGGSLGALSGAAHYGKYGAVGVVAGAVGGGALCGAANAADSVISSTVGAAVLNRHQK
jgi:hypothetical protein